MMRGKIVRLRQDRGFGFIKIDSGDEYFFHAKQCAKVSPFEHLAIGQAVQFEPEAGPQGPRATDVTTALDDADPTSTAV